MEIHPENEPLLIKEGNNLYINKEKSNQKSSKQIISKSCLNSFKDINCSDFPDFSDFTEYFCCCCINYDITQRQYDIHSELSKKCIIPYDKENQEHEKLLLDFFTNIKELIPKEDEEGYIEMNDENEISTNISKDNELNKDKLLIKKLSKKIGFQGNDPSTDFRAGGLYSLEFMNFFINNYKNKTKEYLKEQYFPFALICISLCYKIYLILHLTSDKEEKIQSDLNREKIKGCSRKEMQNFCEHLEKDNEDDLLFLIMSQCLSFIFCIFKKRLDITQANENLLNINPAIDSSLNHFRKTLRNIKKNDDLIGKFYHELEKSKNEETKITKNNLKKD